MDRVDLEYFHRADNRGNVQVALRGWRRANTGRLISEPHMQRVAIDVAVNRDRANAHLFAGPDDPAGNLSPIGDENLSEASRSIHNSEQWAVSSSNFFTAHRSPRFNSK